MTTTDITRDDRALADCVTQANLAVADIMTRGIGERLNLLRRPGASAVISGAPDATLNSIFLSRADVEPAVVADLLALMRESGLPHCVKLRPGLDPAITDLLAGHGLSLKITLPLMIVEPADLVPAPSAANAQVRRIAPEEAELHLALVSEGLEMRRDAVDELFSPANMTLPCWRTYVTETDGEVAATGAAVVAADHVCIMGIVTAPAHRNRGHAAALTTRAVQDGFAAGAERAFLHASDMGSGLYRKLGFRVLERWEIWTT